MGKLLLLCAAFLLGLVLSGVSVRAAVMSVDFGSEWLKVAIVSVSFFSSCFVC